MSFLNKTVFVDPLRLNLDSLLLHEEFLLINTGNQVYFFSMYSLLIYLFLSQILMYCFYCGLMI